MSVALTKSSVVERFVTGSIKHITESMRNNEVLYF